jgi:hypothetical protein
MLKKKYWKTQWKHITGTKAYKALKLSQLTDVLAIAGISLVLLLTVVITVPVMFVYVVVVGAIILWEER